jgi:hypothetical protein
VSADRPHSRPLPYPRPEQRVERLPLPRWIGALALGSIVGFLPWIVYLGFTLPGEVRAAHYDIAWLGFDCAMWTLLAALAFCAIRRHAATGPVAAMASLMLVIDAWFDVFTSSTHHGAMTLAIVLALCGELPLALLCGWAAVHAERIRARAHRNLQRAARVADAVRVFPSAVVENPAGIQPALTGRQLFSRRRVAPRR